MGFDLLLGNGALKSRLGAALAQEKTGHCYLLAGPAGSGKTTLARLLAAALQCEGREKPCGICGSCRKAMAGIHPDIITVDTPDRKTVPVERIRALQADAYIRPNEGRRKVYLFPRAQALTESAQNALLKLIEEPPPYGVFLLLSDNPERLLPTVRSRCQLLRLEPLSQAEALPWLAERFPQRDREALLAAYRRGGGYLGAAAAVLEGELLAPETETLLQCLTRRDMLGLTALGASLERKTREELLALLQAWKALLARALMARSGLPESREAAGLGRALAAPALMRCLQGIDTCLEAADSNVGLGHLCGYLTAEMQDALAL